MTEHTAFLYRLASPRSPQAPGRGGRRASALLLRLCCVALLAWIGYIHLHLWQEGYRQIPTDGPLFLLDAVAAFVLAAALLTWPRALAGLLTAGYTAATLGALLISLTVGLFGSRNPSQRHSSPNPWPSRRLPCSPSSAGPHWWQPLPALPTRPPTTNPRRTR